MSNLNLMPKLTEQVLANIEHINKVEAKVDAHYNMDRVLADYGIRVVGKADTESDLPPVNDYPGTFGDAYIVGIAPPYDFYIYTRPFEGETENQWLDIGLLAIEGPKGETGEQGPKGDTGETGRSTRWYSGQGAPYITASEGDQYLDTTTGNVYQYDNNWVLSGNIKGANGAQGPRGIQGIQGETGQQGPEGPQGPAGYSVVIKGVLTSSSMLPTDTLTIDRNSAYVVEDGTGRWLYFLVDGTIEPEWDKVAFESGTVVLSGGQILTTFNADTKVNAVNQRHVIYGTDINGEGTTYPLDTGEPGSVLLRNGDNTIIIPDPEGELEAANKQYVDNAVANAPYVEARPSGEYDYPIVYTNTMFGMPSYAKVDSNAEMTVGSIPVYQSNGVLNVSPNPAVGTSAVNFSTLSNNLGVRSGIKLTGAQATIQQILVAAGYTTTQAKQFVGRLIIKPNNVTTTTVGSNYGVGLGSSQANNRELEVVFNSSGSAGYIIAYPWKTGAVPTVYGSQSTSTPIYANANVGGMHIQIIPNIMQALL